MSDSAKGDYFNWLRSVTTEPAGADTVADGAAPDDDPLSFAAPGGGPILPRYGMTGADGAPSSASPPAAAPPALTLSDLPTARISAAPLPTPTAPSVSDLPTTQLPGARISSAPAPSPAQDVSDLPTQRVKATLSPAPASAPPVSIPTRSGV